MAKERWVTINGHHVLINSDGIPVRDKDKAIFNSSNVKVGNHNVSVKDESKRNIQDLVDNKYHDTPEYQQLTKDYHEAFKEQGRLEDEIRKANQTAKAHFTMDEDGDPFLASIGLGGSYDEEGKKAKARAEELSPLRKQATEKVQALRNKMELIDTQNAQKELANYKPQPFTKPSRDTYEGFGKQTGNGWLDEKISSGKATLVEMSPKEYMERISYDVFGHTFQNTLNSAYEPKVQKYAKMMREGTKFDIGYIDYQRQEQEGRHRALAAYLNGYDKIPVYIIR